VLVDIAPETAVKRKAVDRDRYERDLDLLGRVRDSYLRQAVQPGWILVNGERPKEDVAADITTAVSSVLSPP
jgi:thymidylate kinase